MPMYVAGQARQPNLDLEVRDKFTGELVSRTPLAGRAEIDEAIAAAAAAAGSMRRLKAYERRDILNHCVTRFTELREELAWSLCAEAGKPIRDARGEVTRLIDTFRIAAEESTRIHGEVMALDISPRSRDYSGQWKRVPIGPCSFISPFNFPLNLVAHKVAPALAVGNPFVLKPASYTPLGALIIGGVLAETPLPPGAFSVLPCRREGADLFSTDERFKLLSFTGSAEVGWSLKAKAGRKRVILELGGNAACIVDRDPGADDVIQRLILGIFYQSGQSCISVQRVLIHQDIYESFRGRLVEAARALQTGDPRLEDTFIGPLIHEKEARRLEEWIASAQQRGARVLCGGRRAGAVLEPTLLENVPFDEPICAEEAFGPVAVLIPFRDFSEAVRIANDSRFGLQAGVFTRDLHHAQQAWNELEVGGVVIGDVPSWRVDHMPYGGVKNSGQGREGVRFSMEEMTEIRLMVLRAPPE
ncbi:MAG: Sulfoacetaldehyde dehydrogenase [Myxococcota bacterium]|nr:Sulfoacetaldehyde dehydrogenase [Myxococcota bacterium]